MRSCSAEWLAARCAVAHRNRRLVMRKFLLAATILAPFAIAPAFADNNGGVVAGNLSGAASISVAGIQAGQSTSAGSMTVGNASSFQSARAGNSAMIETSGMAKASPLGVVTATQTAERQDGYSTTISNTKESWGFGNKAAGGATANQGSQLLGGSLAAGANLNGFVAVEPNRDRHDHR
jgi:hypothetical protein